MRNAEHRLQCACVRWIRLAHPHLLCFAIPNGGNRDAVTGAMLKAEGAMAGAADLIVVKRGDVLFIEMKTITGRQQPSQKEFQQRVQSLGYRYEVCRTFDQFRDIIENFS